MPKSQPLEHLSDAELLELMRRYYAGERVATLLEDYSINCSASVLSSHFPPEPTSERCQHCSAPMVRPRGSKSWLSASVLRCGQCAHSESARCNCSGCKAARLQEEELHTRRQHARIQHFCASRWAYSPRLVQVEDLSAHEAVALICLVRCGGWLDNSTVGPISASGVRMAPDSPDLQHRLIEYLITASLISPAPTSPSNAFIENNGQIVDWDAEQVHWALRMPDGAKFVQGLETLVASSGWPEEWLNECHQIWRELAIGECWEFCVYSLRQRNLPVPGAAAITGLIENLLRDFSVSQCYQHLWSGAGDATDYRARKRVAAQHASNYMIGACQRRADRARAEGWVTKGFHRNFELPRTQLSYVLHDVFLKHLEIGFLQCPATFWQEKLAERK